MPCASVDELERDGYVGSDMYMHTLTFICDNIMIAFFFLSFPLVYTSPVYFINKTNLCLDGELILCALLLSKSVCMIMYVMMEL